MISHERASYRTVSDGFVEHAPRDAEREPLLFREARPRRLYDLAVAFGSLCIGATVLAATWAIASLLGRLVGGGW
jgi:hypothetical protein